MTVLTKLLSDEGKPVVERRKESIHLRLVTFIKQSAHFRTWLDSQFPQVVTRDKRSGALALNFKPACMFQ